MNDIVAFVSTQKVSSSCAAIMNDKFSLINLKLSHFFTENAQKIIFSNCVVLMFDNVFKGLLDICPALKFGWEVRGKFKHCLWRVCIIIPGQIVAFWVDNQKGQASNGYI